MANFVVEETYSDVIEMLTTKSKGHADVFNQIFQVVINNAAYAKGHIDALEENEEKTTTALSGKARKHYIGKAGVDVDTLTTSGDRFFVINATNLPTGYSHGYLDVDYFDGSGFAPSNLGAESIVKQTFRPYNADKVYIRTYNSRTSEFTDWEKMMTDGDAYTHPKSGVTAGTYRSVTVDANGHVTSGSNPTLAIASGGTGATTAAKALTNLGLTATSTELNYCDGVTSAIQTQIDAKQAKITGAATTIASSNLTASRALIANASGKVAVSAVTSTELGYLEGVTSAIQTQLNSKAATDHTHANASTSAYGLTKLSSAVNSTSTTLAATPAAVRKAYEQGRYPYACFDAVAISLADTTGHLFSWDSVLESQVGNVYSSVFTINSAASFISIPYTGLVKVTLRPNSSAQYPFNVNFQTRLYRSGENIDSDIFMTFKHTQNSKEVGNGSMIIPVIAGDFIAIIYTQTYYSTLSQALKATLQLEYIFI